MTESKKRVLVSRFWLVALLITCVLEAAVIGWSILSYTDAVDLIELQLDNHTQLKGIKAETEFMLVTTIDAMVTAQKAGSKAVEAAESCQEMLAESIDSAASSSVTLADAIGSYEDCTVRLADCTSSCIGSVEAR